MRSASSSKMARDFAAQPPSGVDKRLVRRAFNFAAARYDEHAVLQHEVGQRMMERFDLIKIDPARIADVGAGTGRFSRTLGRRYPRARVIALDIAPEMLRVARKHQGWWSRRRRRLKLLCADAEALPLADASIDVLFSNLTLQWCNDLDRALSGFRHVLKPGGLLMFTTFGPDSLRELRASWASVDAHSHTNTFIDMHDIGDALVRAGLTQPVLDVEHFTLTYSSVSAIMRDLKALGAHNVTTDRPRGLTGKTRMAALHDAYETYRHEGVLPVTYEVIYGHAWAPEATQARAVSTTVDGTVHVPLTQLKRPLKEG